MDETCKNCISLKKVLKHPWNEGVSKGKMTETFGFGCTLWNHIVFLDKDTGSCEMHQPKSIISDEKDEDLNCIHEWKEYGKHRIKCYKCQFIKYAF